VVRLNTEGTAMSTYPGPVTLVERERAKSRHDRCHD
jgi:hypothetical protein